MHSFEVSLGYESVDRTTFSTWLPRFIENVLRSTLSYPNETSKECIQFLNTYDKNVDTLYNMTLLHHIPNHATWFLKTISCHKYEERRIEAQVLGDRITPFS